MAVRMLDVALTDAPRFIRRRPGNGHTLRQGELVGCIYFGRRVYPPAHPHATGIIIETQMPRRGTAARALSILAKKYLDFSAAYAAKACRIAPIPAFLPAKLFKPGETLRDI